MPDYTYDLALSFAGEDREVARAIAHVAQANDLGVFFDEHYLWETWGKDLTEALGRIYSDEARYCLLLISEDYCTKPCTNFERRMAVSRALESKEEYVLPVLLDDSWPPGLPRTTAFFDLRVTSTAEVAEAAVRKVKGADWVMRPADDAALPRPVPVAPPPAPVAAPQSIVFADVAIADECKSWQEGGAYIGDGWSAEPARWSFAGGMGWYEDPILDITVLNRSAVPRLMTKLGIEVLGAGYGAYGAYGGLGGGGPQPVHLHRTYELPIPDVWAALAAGLRAAGDVPGEQPFPCGPVEMTQLGSCRLPDPILVDPGGAYRFGLHLLDYTSLCPTEVELVFWAQTDEGTDRSPRARMSYFIGGAIQPVDRFTRLLQGPAEEDRQAARPLESGFFYRERERNEKVEQAAYFLWDKAGRPEGRQQEFWVAGERELGRSMLIERTLATVHTRDL